MDGAGVHIGALGNVDVAVGDVVVRVEGGSSFSVGQGVLDERRDQSFLLHSREDGIDHLR